MYAKQSWRLLAGEKINRVNFKSSLGSLRDKSLVSSFAQAVATQPVKCKQRVCRPLGGISPLSDRAPRYNGDVRRPSEYDEAKATSAT